LSPTGIVAGSATWRSSSDSYWATHQAEFQCIAEEVGVAPSTEWIWSYPQDFRGEQGDQGPNGDYYFNMYMASPTQPATPNYLVDDMLTLRGLSWKKLPEITGIIWQTRGRFNGETNPPQVDGYPPNAALSEEEWGAPVKLTGTDGIDGNPGTEGADGNTGYSPKFAIESDGVLREVLRLVDWIGGSGTKPGNVGDYIGNVGFVSTPGEAINIKGKSVQIQVGGSTWTQGTPKDGDLWIDRV
jgi:hypothetical protein